MGKVIVLISTTPDGFAESQNVIIDPEFFEFVHSLLANTQLIVFGRRTFEQFQDRWPERLTDSSSPEWIRNMAQSMNDIPKTVFSSTLKTTTWQNSEIIPQLDLAHIQNFKDHNEGTLLTFGSLSIVESLIAMDVVDEYYFNIQPLLPGRGEARFFQKTSLETTHRLKYVNCINLSSGAHIIHYQKQS